MKKATSAENALAPLHPSPCGSPIGVVEGVLGACGRLRLAGSPAEFRHETTGEDVPYHPFAGLRRDRRGHGRYSGGGWEGRELASLSGRISSVAQQREIGQDADHQDDAQNEQHRAHLHEAGADNPTGLMKRASTLLGICAGW